MKKINISASINKIGDRAFTNCKSLDSITLSNDVIEIGKSAFGGCSSLTTVTIPNRVTKISEGLFGKCKSLTNVIIPNGVTEIGDKSFAGCESLNGVIIPKTVTKIGNRAFVNCKNIDIFVIPNSVTNVGTEVFGGCLKLQTFTLPTRFTIFKDDVNKQIDLSTNANNPFKTSKVGDYVKFGSYPQTSSGGVQPIEWQVLSIENNRMLVISRYGLDCKIFDSSSNNWANSEIRKWLNGEFYNKAFTDQEKKSIKSSNLSDVGTTDNVFLLSLDEAKKYFANDNARKCKATEYAVKNGSYVYDNGCSWWWLRSPYDTHVYDVLGGGDVYYCSVFNSSGVVRLALWVNL